VEITEIRIKLMEDSEDRLRAFCSITIDGCFVVRDLKIIDGTNGPFVAMPSRKLSGHCQRCRHKNHLRATYCNQCGVKLQMDSDHYDSPQKLYADVAHPINSECREMIQNAVIHEFNAELDRYQEPGYRSRYDDDFDYDDAASESSQPATTPAKPSGTPAKPSGGTKSSSPPRPHFIDEPKQRESSPSPQDDGDQFGAGVFS
jgi:stage V sporulation protein G